MWVALLCQGLVCLVFRAKATLGFFRPWGGVATRGKGIRVNEGYVAAIPVRWCHWPSIFQGQSVVGPQRQSFPNPQCGMQFVLDPSSPRISLWGPLEHGACSQICWEQVLWTWQAACASIVASHAYPHLLYATRWTASKGILEAVWRRHCCGCILVRFCCCNQSWRRWPGVGALPSCCKDSWQKLRFLFWKK